MLFNGCPKLCEINRCCHSCEYTFGDIDALEADQKIIAFCVPDCVICSRVKCVAIEDRAISMIEEFQYKVPYCYLCARPVTFIYSSEQKWAVDSVCLITLHTQVISLLIRHCCLIKPHYPNRFHQRRCRHCCNTKKSKHACNIPVHWS
jgi:hypothetical protein